MNTIAQVYPEISPTAGTQKNQGLSWKYERFKSDLNIVAGVPNQSESERVIRCWCCYDTGTVSFYLLNKYGIMDAQIPDPAVQCKATGCNGGYTQIVSLQTGETNIVPKFAYGLDDRLTTADCDFIAKAQLAEARVLNAAAESMPNLQDGADVIRAIVQEQNSDLGTSDKVHECRGQRERDERDRVAEHAASASAALADIFGDIA